MVDCSTTVLPPLALLSVFLTDKRCRQDCSVISSLRMRQCVDLINLFFFDTDAATNKLERLSVTRFSRVGLLF